MRIRLAFGVLLIAGLAVLPGCGDGRERCYRVTGEIYVDGKPAADCFLYLQPAEGTADPKRPHPFGRTDENGSFAVSSYVAGDGAPPGDYVLTFKWPEPSGTFKQQFDGPDRLKQKYADPAKSEYHIKVEKKDNAFPRYELTTPK